MKFTFGIITSGHSDDLLSKCIDSIKKLSIPEYEIIVIGNTSILDNIIKIPFDESVKDKWITRKKNLITQHANYENIVYCHDYIVFGKNWYNGFLKYGNNFNLCMTQILNKDNTRFRDWCIWIWNHNFMDEIVKSNSECLIPYDMNHLSKYMYFSGAYWVAKKNIMMEFPLNENLCWGQGEDVVWSKQVREKYNFSMNKYSIVRLLKQQEVAFNVATPKTILKLNTYFKNY